VHFVLTKNKILTVKDESFVRDGWFDL